LDLGEIQKLIRLVKRTGIGELEVSEGGRTVRIAAWPANVPVGMNASSAPAPGPIANPAPAGAATPAPAAEDRLQKIVSPMVGTFYRSPAPDADAYVDVGERVEAGQTVCIIEAMKLMNEIESEVRGRVVRVAVENGQPVEYGQVLFLIDPQG
jgi:acetyl-CoA carboxylase biotin carboxyl carrier protein